MKLRGSFNMKFYRMDEICQLITDGTHQTPTYSEEGYIFLSSKDVTSKKICWDNVKYIPEELHVKLSKRLKPQVNDILLAKNGTTGVAAIVEKEVDFDIYVSLALLRPKAFIQPRYLYHIINSPYMKKQFDKSLKGVGVPNLHLKEIRSSIVPVPNLESQKLIVSILDKAMLQIDSRLEQIQLVDDLVQSIFNEMFGNPIINQMNWEVSKLKELSTKISSGSTPKGGSKVYVDNGVKFYRSQNVWRNDLREDDIVHIDYETHSKMKKSSLQYGDILMTKTGRINTENSSLGRAAMYLGDSDKANVNGHVYLIRLNEVVSNHFVLFILTTKAYRDYIRKICVGGIDKRQINKTHIEDFPIILPPKDRQIEFLSKLSKLEKFKAQLIDSLSELERNYDSLVQEAVSEKLFNTKGD